MKSFLYPTFEEALLLHQALIDRFGGEEGLRDGGLLMSALGRPQTGYYKSLSSQGAALLQSLAKNHAFLDGNKRMAFALTAVFLRMNGYKIIVNADLGEDFIVKKVLQENIDLNAITDWLEKYMKKA